MTHLAAWILTACTFFASACADPKPTTTAPPPTIVTFASDPATIVQGGESKLSWSLRDASVVTVFDGQGIALATFESSEALSGSLDVSPEETTTYKLEAVNAPEGETPSETRSALATVTVTAPSSAPTLTLQLTPDTILPGQEAVLMWTSTDANALALTANAVPIAFSPADLAQGSLTVSPQGSTIYSMTATGPGGTTTQTATLNVQPATDIIAFTATPQEVEEGQPSSLAWTVEGADTIALSAGDSPINVASKNVEEDAIAVFPNQTTTYTLTASGPFGEETAQVTVTIAADPAPSITSFAADPSEVLRGETSTLSWSTTEATSVELFADETRIDTNGKDPAQDSITVNPTETTIYRLRATNSAGSVEETTSIRITGDPSPVLSVGLSTDTIDAGQNATLSWQTANVTALRIEADPPPSPNITNLPTESGEIQVSPSATTRYTVIASGPGGEVRDTVTLSVNPAVDITSFSTTTPQIEFGEHAELTWNVEHAQDVTLSYNDTTNTVSATGSQSVPNLTETTTFVLTANGVGGPVARSVTVNVRLPGTPEIRNFIAAPETVDIDDTVTLSWSALEATSLTLIATPENRDPVEIDITDQPLDIGSITLTPQRSTTYTLTASNVSGSSQATANVRVPLEILALTPPSDAVEVGADAVVSWRVQGANRLTLRRSTGDTVDVAVDDEGNGQIVLENITEPTPITLRAFDVNENITFASATIGIQSPTVTQWTATPPAGASRETYTLTWGTRNATSITVEGLNSQGDTVQVDVSGANPANGSVNVNLEYTTTFTLTAQNAVESTTAQTQITITNEPAPANILNFSSDPTTVQAGENVTLLWTTSGATALRIETTSGTDAPPIFIESADIATGETVVENVSEDTTWTLIATGTDGVERTQTTQVTVQRETLGLVLSEVFYNPPSSDNEREWVEIYNGTGTTVDLSGYALGSGGTDYTNSTVQLSGILQPGDCFVVGGPLSDASNYNPTLNQPVDFNPDFQNAGSTADAIALFNVTADQITSNTTPIDAVIYGNTNSNNLIDSTGNPGTVNTTTTNNQSNERTSTGWRVQTSPTPNDCSALFQ